MALTPSPVVDNEKLNEKSHLIEDRLKNFNTMVTTEIKRDSDVIIISDFGPEPQILKCPYCNKFVSTKIKRKPTAKTHLYALLLSLCCCWICGFCLCPYCTGVFQDAEHRCSECDSFLGRFRNQ